MPRIPRALKPVIQGYGIGSPEGVSHTEVGGGMPRSAMLWDRGPQPFQVTLLLTPDKFSVWTTFFTHIIKKGALSFTMPLDSGFGLEDHDCLMVPDSYSAARAGGQVTSVSFVVKAESKAYAMTAAEAQSILDYWEAVGEPSSDLLRRIAQFANEDTLVLGP